MKHILALLTSLFILSNALAFETWNKKFISPVFSVSSVKNEDWGSDGENQKSNPNVAGKKASE